MPLSFVRTQTPRVYLPGYKSLSAGSYQREAEKAYASLQTGVGKYSNAFEPGQMVRLQNGSANLNANELIANALKEPMYAAEAPLRPFAAIHEAGVPIIGDIIGAVGNVAGAVGNVAATGIRAVPGLRDVVGAVGEGFKAADYAGAAGLNFSLADALKTVAGKSDDYVLKDWSSADFGLGGGLTAGEIRRRAAAMWSTDLEGNHYTLAQLEERARNNPWDFGQFATSENGLVDFVMRAGVNPTNLAFLGAGSVVGGAVAGAARMIPGVAKFATEFGGGMAAAEEYFKAASQAADWAKPVMKATNLTTPYKFGYGYARTLGRGMDLVGATYKASHSPIPRAFIDLGNAAKDVLTSPDGMARSGHMGSVLTSAAWIDRGLAAVRATGGIARKVYFPGLNTELRGTRLAGDAVRSWLRGGLQQQAITQSGEFLTGLFDPYKQEDGLNPTIEGGSSNLLHDIFTKINNEHIISDNEGVFLASLFFPIGPAARESLGALSGVTRAGKMGLYGNNVAAHIFERSTKDFGATFKSVDEMLSYWGKGDREEGIRRLLWWTEHTEINKVGNELSDFLHRVADANIDGMASRLDFVSENLWRNLERRRKSGAIQPKSTVDTMFERHMDAGLEPGAKRPTKAGERPERGLSSQFTPTGTSMIDEANRMFDIFTALAPGMRDLGLSIRKGGILSKEQLDTIIAQVEKAGDFDKAMARQIIDNAPSLVYLNPEKHDFWRQFALTLGGESKPARMEVTRGKKYIRTEAEAVSKDDLLAALGAARDLVPSEQEMFHEAIRMAKSSGKLQKGFFNIKEPPYHMGDKLKADSLKITGRIRTLATNEKAVTRMRETEFFKNGKPKFGSAKEITNSRGMTYSRQADGFYSRSDGVAVGIEGGAIRTRIPATREGELLDQLGQTIFQRGPRKGQIKPGREAESQKLNIDIEALRMGIDRDALLTGIENGGRVVVTSPIAGDFLARHGFKESARIEHRYPKWIDPGAKPDLKPRDGTIPGSRNTQEGDRLAISDLHGGEMEVVVDKVNDDGTILIHATEGEFQGQPDLIDYSEVIANKDTGFKQNMAQENWDEYAARAEDQRKWNDAMFEGIMRGELTPEQAMTRGWENRSGFGVGQMKPAPETLYHTTVSTPGVRNYGLLTGHELEQRVGAEARPVGLGGAPGHLISFTDSKEVADRVAEVTVEVGKVIRGEIPLSELGKRAEAGGFYDNWVGSLMEPDLARDDYTFYTPVTAWDDAGNYKPVYQARPMTEEEMQMQRYIAYKEFLRLQWQHQHIMDPYLAENSMRSIRSYARTRPEDVQVLKVQPKTGKVLGIQDRSESYLEEWKMIPDTVHIEGISDAASYAFVGGDPHAVEQKSAAGSFAPYRPTKRIERSEKAAIGVARGESRQSSILSDYTWGVGDAMTKDTAMFPEERLRTLKEHTRAYRNRYKVELQRANNVNDAAFQLLPFDKKITDMSLRDWTDGMNATEVRKVADFFEMASQFPEISFDPSPKVIVEPTADRMTAFASVLSRRQKMLVDYGVLSPIQRFYDALLAPKHVRWLGKQTQDEVHNLLTLSGWDPSTTRKWLEAVRKEVLDSRAVVGLNKLTGTHKYPNVAALPEEKLRALARDIDPMHASAVIDRYGSYQHMLTQASNRLLRSVERKRRAGAPLNKIEAAADAAFRTWQYAPGFRSVAGAGQRFTKYTYPLLRFASDPLFVGMNYIEPYAYNILNNGWRGLRSATPEAKRNLELATARLVPPGGLLSKDAPMELLLADPGVYTYPHNIQPNIEAEFGIRSQREAELMFEALGPNHPIAEMMRERFGDNVKDWAGEFNKMLANLVHNGPEFVTRKAFKDTLEGELGFTHKQLEQLAPVAEALTERYRGLAADLTDLYVGRMNRSNLERFANNFFMFWPVSYMVKVTGWAYRVLFEQIGPVKGSGGAYLWDQYRQAYEREVQNNSDFASFVDDNPDFLFALDMLMPITPTSVGASLNKTTRYVGNWVANETQLAPGIFGDYTPESVPELLSNSLRFGPFRTAKMANNILKSFEVPGFYTAPSPRSGGAQYAP